MLGTTQVCESTFSTQWFLYWLHVETVTFGYTGWNKIYYEKIKNTCILEALPIIQEHIKIYIHWKYLRVAYGECSLDEMSPNCLII